MGFIERISDILGSNINALLDKAEDPVKQAKYYLEKYLKDLAECKRDTAIIAAQAKARKREMEQAQADVDKLTNMARNAIKDGNEEAARSILTRKAAADQCLAQATENYNIAKKQTEQMVEVYNKLAADIKVCRARVQNIEATVALAKGQEKVAGIMSKYGAGSSAGDKLARAQEKATARLDTAQSIVDLDIEDTDPEDLEAKYGDHGSVAVDDELARLKAELGMA